MGGVYGRCQECLRGEFHLLKSLTPALLNYSNQDIGIATFLMLLWRDTYPAIVEGGQTKWGRPPGGFVDAG
jgi:hypothetical protein